jgi:hypothetical protein
LAACAGSAVFERDHLGAVNTDKKPILLNIKILIVRVAHAWANFARIME